MKPKNIPFYQDQSHSGGSKVLLLVICFGVVILAGALFYHFRFGISPPPSEAVAGDELDAAQVAAQAQVQQPVAPRAAVPLRQRAEGLGPAASVPTVAVESKPAATDRCPEAEEA